MGLIEINRNPSRRDLLWFATAMVVLFAVIGLVLFWRFGSGTAAGAVWATGAVLVLVFAVVPAARRPLYLGWMYAVLPLGWLLSHVLLALMYYLVFTPIGLVMRLAGCDPMRRRFDPDAPSYWVEHRPGGDPSRYFRQF